MKKIFFISAVVAIISFLLIPVSFAETESNYDWRFKDSYDWYIKDFQAEFILNNDSTMLVTEKITADVNMAGKHGIFRALPLKRQTPSGKVDAPIKLISITDFSGKSLKYSTTYSNNTVTWKIGDANKEVIGDNYYKITYLVKNVITFNNPNFDEFYWNLLGDFWNLDIEKFSAKIVFPEVISINNTNIWHYDGYLNEKGANLADYQWINKNILFFESTNVLNKGQGITASITLPKNIFKPYKVTFFDKCDHYWSWWFLLPFVVFVICFFLWKKYGKDPKINKTIIPEFEIPDNLSPLEMGVLMKNGKMKSDFVTATIINLAVRGLISIEEIKGNWSTLMSKDYKFKKLFKVEDRQKMTEAEILLIDGLFADDSSIGLWDRMNIKKSLKESSFSFDNFNSKDEILISSLKKNKLVVLPVIEAVENKVRDILDEKGYLEKKSLNIRRYLYLIAFLVFLTPIVFFNDFLELVKYLDMNDTTFILLVLCIIISFFVCIFFTYLMPRRTQKGAELMWRIKGFKLYMQTAEKYRQQFNEKENIFEKLLPYAMVFGMTKLWIKKMEQIYGSDYFTAYHPIWYVGMDGGGFDFDSFSSGLNGITAGITSSIGGSGTGAGGGGSSGGGGGGGGGGGW